MKRSTSLIVRSLGLLAGLGLLLAACGDDGGSSSSDGGDAGASDGGCDSSVCMEGIAYTEPAITVGAGDTVSWTNLDTVDHTVTEGTPGAPVDGGFDSGNVAVGETFEVVADDAGEIAYFCTIHPQMEGSVTVE